MFGSHGKRRMTRIGDWDDYRFFAAVVRAGSVRGAALELRVNASTVTRRLEQLERRVGVELFTRQASGLEITRRGREVAARVEQLGRELSAIDSELREDQGSLTGEVVLGVPAIWIPPLLPHLSALHDAEPGLDIELQDGATFRSHTGADLWVEATPAPSSEFIARPLGRPGCALAGQDSIVTDWPSRKEAGSLFWLSLEDPLLGPSIEPPLRDPDFSDLPVRLQTRSALQQLFALETGLGIGVMPLALIDGRSRLRKLSDRQVSGLPHWLLARAELRRVRRLQVVADWLRRAFGAPEFAFSLDET
jgi:DNA-binding transcriptional LysR family regulator